MLPVLFHRVRNLDKVALEPLSLKLFRIRLVSSLVSRVPASLSSAIAVLNDSYQVSFILYLQESTCHFVFNANSCATF